MCKFIKTCFIDRLITMCPIVGYSYIILGPNLLCCLAIVISWSWKVAVGFNDSSSELNGSASELNSSSSELRISLSGVAINRAYRLSALPASSLLSLWVSVASVLSLQVVS